MKRYLKYLRYVLKHKMFVAKECFKEKLYLQGIFHDWTKLTWKEFSAYANHFYGEGNEAKYKAFANTKGGYAKTDDETDSVFNDAWLHHVHHNPHHWQYWVMINGNGDKPLEMPMKYRKEMVCDWIGAGRSQGRGWKNEVSDWYNAHKMSIKLGQETKKWVEERLK